MESKLLSWQSIMEFLRQRVTKEQTSVIVEARIAITPKDTKLLEIRPSQNLETIQF